ncbi:hypothetical protein AWM79_21745 [Pseudomonas agarici]|uniref:Lipoprotein n=1 Tax=Pseudomonas agarici TaxID=46677 RepID=A0A0X1T6K2_PSEAA|nr:hypothetical protein [Pseudomonas agarici]AMB87760.1 hypothetical protein AWM79_21745 [Pseudomonas agarici]NWB93057.1 hypothetical protein [Pseudomonas agarici]NWC10110.1 hypothetical protein [Pseudomonas agarici]SEL71898.1 hypothetical protein SAMN05216604_12920 [Pseudomonas agarici]
MKHPSIMTTSLLMATLLLLGGCDQAEKSAQQLLGKAAETAKQALDDTHKAADQALSEVIKGLPLNPSKPAEETEKSSQEI